MEHYSVSISPREFLTHHRNKLELAIKKTGNSDGAEVSAKLECRLVADGAVKERYLLGEQAFSIDSSPGPIMLEWELALTKKGPLTFSSPFFSLTHVVLVTIRDKNGMTTAREIPLQVAPGRIMEREES